MAELLLSKEAVAILGINITLETLVSFSEGMPLEFTNASKDLFRA
jgi:hypothetical protein